MKYRPATALTWLATALALFAGSGASCQRPFVFSPFLPPGPAAPQVLAPGATRDEIVAAVNANSSRIHSLTATGASITIPNTLNLPILTANVAAQRPGRIRLTAGTALTGQEIDLGSNDELFWIWLRRKEPPAVYFCRHEQFASSAIRQMMPIEPAWLLAALGIVEIDPSSVYDGPVPHGDGTVEIRSWLPSASGTLQRVTAIDAARAFVVEQHVYDPSGQTLLASAVAQSHRYYPVEQVSLPQRIELQLPTADLTMTIDLGVVEINRLAAGAQRTPQPRASSSDQLWSMPALVGYPQYDLGGAMPGTPLPGQPQAQFVPTGVVPAAYQPLPAEGYPPYAAPQFAR